ncbi:MAG: hypothetical protein KDD89_17170, partial [Anaerolineales bacterium]|nr:hypothetical protein [Anaerolineales bacterium]
MSPGITIIGLGPGDSQLWTEAAAQYLRYAIEVHVYTSHPSLPDIPGRLRYVTPPTDPSHPAA